MQANDLNHLFEALKNTGGGEADEKQVKNAVNSLSAEQREKLNAILASPEKMKAFFQSDKAQEMLKKLGKKDT